MEKKILRTFSVGWESENIVQLAEWEASAERGSEICDELTKLVSAAVSTNQIEAFGAKTAKTLKISGELENLGGNVIENVRKCELGSNQQIANQGG